jgi:peptidyl-prolyl cis-trans isomerase D
MLQDIRANSQGTIAKIIIGLIVISFSIFGIESLLFSGGTTAVAEVNGEEITPFDLQQELSVQQRRILSMLGDDADPALLDDAIMSQQALEALVRREIVRQAAAEQGLAASPAMLGELIASMEQFQIDGRFSRDMFQSALAAAGFTPALFRDRLAEDVQVGQLQAGLLGSDFATPRELAVAARISGEARDVRYATIPAARFLDSVEVSDDAVRSSFEANADRYRSEESLDLTYIELRLDDYLQPVSEDRLRQEFDLVRDEFEVPTETRVSHILLEGDADDNAEAVREIMTALDSGTPFAELAGQRSTDLGSASSGGDLGFTAGDTFPEPMEEAIAGLAVGEVSGAVETDAGTHLILVTDRREGTAVSFESVRAELEDRIQRSDASDDLLLDVERLRDVAFNAADLQEPARELDREVQSATGVTRTSGPGLFADASLREAAFSDDVLVQKHNSEVIELDSDHYVVLHVAQRNPAAPLPFEDVAAQLRSELERAAARDQARATAEAIRDAVAGGASMEDAAREADVEWQVELGAVRSTTRVPPALLQRLFTMTPPKSGESAYDVVATATGDVFYAMEFAGRREGSVDELPPMQREQLLQRIAGETAGILQAQYEEALRTRAEVVVY